MSQILIGVLILGGLGVAFGIVLAVAYQKLRVEEDPRLGEVEELLPGTNCGACGQPGCRAFAEKLLEGAVQPSQCTVSPAERVEEIAQYLGVDAGEAEKRVARLLCAGGRRESPPIAEYEGIQSCRALAVVSGGNKACVWGCLGLGDCEEVCDFDAIHMNDNDLPVVDVDKCTACGDCVEICPKDLFVLMPIQHKLIVQCKSLLEGDEALEACNVACNACGRCVADAPPGTMEMRGPLPWVDYSKMEQLSPKVTKRCPTGAIVWVEKGQFEQDVRPKPLGKVDVIEDISS